MDISEEYIKLIQDKAKDDLETLQNGGILF